MSEEEQALQHLIERCDVKIATHIDVMIAIIFGSFTILGTRAQNRKRCISD